MNKPRFRGYPAPAEPIEPPKPKPVSKLMELGVLARIVEFRRRLYIISSENLPDDMTLKGMPEEAIEDLLEKESEIVLDGAIAIKNLHGAKISFCLYAGCGKPKTAVCPSCLLTDQCPDHNDPYNDCGNCS